MTTNKHVIDVDADDGSVDMRIADMMQAAQLTPDVDAFVIAAMAEFGGPGGLAKCLHEDYEIAKERNQVNVSSSIIKTVVELMKLSAAKNKQSGSDVEQLSPSEMRAAIKRLKLE